MHTRLCGHKRGFGDHEPVPQDLAAVQPAAGGDGGPDPILPAIEGHQRHHVLRSCCYRTLSGSAYTRRSPLSVWAPSTQSQPKWPSSWSTKGSTSAHVDSTNSSGIVEMLICETIIGIIFALQFSGTSNYERRVRHP